MRLFQKIDRKGQQVHLQRRLRNNPPGFLVTLLKDYRLRQMHVRRAPATLRCTAILVDRRELDIVRKMHVGASFTIRSFHTQESEQPTFSIGRFCDPIVIGLTVVKDLVNSVIPIGRCVRSLNIVRRCFVVARRPGQVIDHAERVDRMDGSIAINIGRAHRQLERPIQFRFG